MSSLPTHAGNDILRASLPIMTASRMNDLAAQLLDRLPLKRGGERRKKRGERREDKLPIGSLAVTKRQKKIPGVRRDSTENEGAHPPLNCELLRRQGPGR